jgi:hypothetical protein
MWRAPAVKPAARIDRSRPRRRQGRPTVTSSEVTLTITSLVDALRPGVSFSDSASGRGC